jgi:hypothetical protein
MYALCARERQVYRAPEPTTASDEAHVIVVREKKEVV